MTPISFLLERFATQPGTPALAWKGHIQSYGELSAALAEVQTELDRAGIGNGTVVAIRGDYSFYTTALLLALIDRRAIVIPLLPSSLDMAPELLEEVQPEVVVDAIATPAAFHRRPSAAPNQYYRELARRNAPGLVLFTSGSTGKPKAVIHDFSGSWRSSKPPERR